MNPLVYFGIAMSAGIITSLSCALGKMISSEPDKASNYPDSDRLDNRVTGKRLIWMFRWLLQGVVGGLVVAFIFADQVFNNGFSAGVVWALAFIAGSVAWFNFKESVSAIKRLLPFEK